MILFDNSWTFGSEELISTIAAFCTLLAVITSLVIANRGKVLKYKVTVNYEHGGLSIYNIGHARFNITNFGIIDGDKFIYNKRCAYSKLLPHGEQININAKSFQEISTNVVSVEPGDMIEVALEDFDFETIKNKKTYLFLKINNKIKRFKINVNQCRRKQVTNMSKYVSANKKEIYSRGYFFRRP